MKSIILDINYGINKKSGRKRILHRCGKLKVIGNWDLNSTHERIRMKIKERHPSWFLTGYCVDKK